MKIIDLLKNEGIRSSADLAKWCVKHGKPGQSRYDVIVSKFGEVNAIRIMRMVEVASWELTK